MTCNLCAATYFARACISDARVSVVLSLAMTTSDSTETAKAHRSRKEVNPGVRICRKRAAVVLLARIRQRRLAEPWLVPTTPLSPAQVARIAELMAGAR